MENWKSEEEEEEEEEGESGDGKEERSSIMDGLVPSFWRKERMGR